MLISFEFTTLCHFVFEVRKSYKLGVYYSPTKLPLSGESFNPYSLLTRQ